MPISVFIDAPYSLSLGDSIYTQIIAINYYGQSILSYRGTGATCVLVPSPPITLKNNPNVTSESSVGFTW